MKKGDRTPFADLLLRHPEQSEVGTIFFLSYAVISVFVQLLYGDTFSN